MVETEGDKEEVEATQLKEAKRSQRLNGQAFKTKKSAKVLS